MNLKPFLFLFLLACLIAPAAAAGGSGTAANPYIIETAAELQSIQNNLGAYYRLANDIDLSGVTWSPIGSESAGFHGSLDGNGKTIKNLALSASTRSAGFFGMVTSGAIIKDLILEDCHVESTAARCGCLIGSIIMTSSAHETATIQNIEMIRCSTTSNQDYIAVLCGFISTYADVDIIDCTLTSCDVGDPAFRYSGILCGGCITNSNIEINGCTVTNSYIKISADYVGILCGMVLGSNLIMKNCIVDSCIVDGELGAGLLCGSCISGGTVSSENCNVNNSIAKANFGQAGGIFGTVSGSGSGISASGCTITDCTILAGNYAGGIAGRVQTGTTGVFNSCTVTACTILATSYTAGICPAYS